jgi:hypothetical protein
MSSEEVSQSTGSTYRYLHLSPEEVAQLSADERLQACLFRSFVFLRYYDSFLHSNKLISSMR